MSLNAKIESLFAAESLSGDAARLREIIQIAIDSSPDPTFIADPVTMRFLYVNETACRLEGCAREEYLKKSPVEAARLERAELERLYEEVIAKGDAGVTT